MFMEAILEVVRDNADYIPPQGKGSLYIRPVIWGTGAVLGVKPAQSYTFLVFVSPVGHYFKNSEKSLHLKITNKFHRAAPRGTGGFKAIGNYAASLLPQKLAKKAGFDEVIYLNAANENFVEEVGSANLFILKDQTLVTPALTGSILPGVTRDSVIQIAKKILRLEVQEREVSVDEVLDADEVFCSGTAVTVTSIGEITTDKTFRIISDGEIGPYTMRISEILSGIRNETVEDQFEWLFPVF
jgi:branched-chain amino acid aminotransferase